jgi:two-component system phosphate regulon sensor histidine kinase PhoR
MTTSTGDDTVRATAARVATALVSNRWMIAAAVIVLALLYVVGDVGLGTAMALFVLFVAALGLQPLTRTGEQMAARNAPASSARLEPGLKLFAEALPDPCFILDRRGVVAYANRHATSYFAIRIGDALTFRLRVPDLLAAFDAVAKGGSPRHVEFVERVPTERWFDAWFARLDPNGERAGEFILLILDDMTERRRSERVRVDFVANASHELRTPLASLTGFIETLRGPAREDAEARDRFLAIMHEQADRMARLVDDLLSLSRIEMKEHVRPTDRVDLASASRHVVDSLEPLARDLGVSLEIKLPPQPAIVVGDRDELIQVFENLVENACKYGQSGKRVLVTVTPAAEGSGPSVEVRDFGPGIAADHLPRLTERFYRVDVEASRQHRGTGLGLAIVKHILARHQARMTVESTLGEGAAFTVVFPQATAGPDSGRGQEEQSEQRLTVS